MALCFYNNYTQAQIGIGTINPNSSSVLELKSDSLGFLPPRMTTSQRDGISSPAEGLVIFNIITNCLEWHTINSWVSLCTNSMGTLNCLNSSVHGTYQALTTLTTTNYISIEVNVTQIGAWSIKTNIVNGCLFKGSGVFVSTGVQTITILGYGTPSTFGQFNYTTVYGTSSCSFGIMFNEAPTGNGILNCSSLNVHGIYNVGQTTNSSHYISIDINVSTAGTFLITTNTNNGVSFSTGTLTLTLGIHTIYLYASGASILPGVFGYNVSYGASSCPTLITYLSSSPLANFIANNTIICEVSMVQFTDLSTNNPTSWSWDFVGGSPSTSTLQNPLVTYNTEGSYTVSLIATNSSGSDSETKTSYIHVGSISNAGPDQTGLSTCGLTTVTLAANTPTVGTGAWSIISGTGGTITTPTNPTSTFSGTAGTSYTLRWTISNSPCIASTDDVNISFNQNPTIAAAGPDQTGSATCGLTIVTLAANTPTVGTGAWSIISGTGGTITTPTSPTSTFSGTAGTSYTLRWTISNSPCIASTDDVNISFNQNPTIAAAGLDQTGAATCGLTIVTLAANTPTVGIGAWSIISGLGGTVTTPSNPTSTFSGTAGTAYTLRWTISNAPCTSSTDDVLITFNQNPTIAEAGPDQIGVATCGLTSVALSANSPTIGIGSWSIISGAGGTITTPSSPTSAFSGIAGTAYTLRWTISNSPCTASTDDVNITFNQNPSTAAAGPDQTGSATCGLTSVTLAGNSPTLGTGAWSIVSGLGGTVTTPSSPTSTFSGTAGTAYTLRWTISNSPCIESTDDVNVTFNAMPPVPTGNASQSFCSISSPTVVNLFASGTAIKWYATSSGGTPLLSSTALVNNTHYYASQTVSVCESTSRLDVTATVNSTPSAPTGTASQSFCAPSTVANLIATGTAIQWYAASIGGTALASSTVLVNNTHYYASQTVSGCESSARFNVTATVVTTAAPTGNVAPTFCSSTSPTVANLTATGTSIQWYATSLGGTALASSTALVGGTHYYASQTLNGCSSYPRLDVTVTVTTTPLAPTGSSAQSYCNLSKVSSLTASGTTIKWYAASTGGSALSPTTSLVNGTHYYASQTVSGCESSTRLDVTVTLIYPPSGYFLDDEGITCLNPGQSGVLYSCKINYLTGATGYSWTYSGDGFSIVSGDNTNSIIADFSASATAGTLTVTSNNICGNGPFKSFVISLSAISSCGGTYDYTHTVVAATYTWLDRNLGASRVATSSYDYEAYGSLFNWGRKSDGHECMNWCSSTKGSAQNGNTSTQCSNGDCLNALFVRSSAVITDWNTPLDNSLWNGTIKGVNDPCPSGYRVPSYNELLTLSWTFGWGAGAEGAINSPVKMPMPGGRNAGTQPENSYASGSSGYYWTSTGTAFSNVPALLMINNSGAPAMASYGRSFGTAVRCIAQ